MPGSVPQAAIAGSNDSARYLRSVWAPGDERCMCLFEASSPEAVAKLNEDAGLPYRRIVEVRELNP